MGVEYGAIDVLPALQPLREVTTEISDWQTFPQLYVNGELLGGADIVEEMTSPANWPTALGVEQPETAEAPVRLRARRPRARRCRSKAPEPYAKRPQRAFDGPMQRRSGGRRLFVFDLEEEPQPQAATTFGLFTWKPAP